MNDDIQLNVPLLRRRVPNLTTAAKAVGLRPATVSNLCTGKIPVARAEVRTLVTLANLAGCTLDELIIRGGGGGMMESGIKVLDLFAPLVRGGTIGLVARTNTGQLVLVQELLHRFGLREYLTVFWCPTSKEEGSSSAEFELLKLVMDHARVTGTSLDEVYELIKANRNDKDIILVADRRTVLSGGLWTLKEKLQEAGSRPITTILVDISGECVDAEMPFGPLDTLLNFDMNLSSRSLFPAVDPVTSTSTLLEGTHLESTHITIAGRARKTLRRYKELRFLVSAQGLDRLSHEDKVTYHRGERLEAFLSQPFFVAEPWTKRSGQTVSLEDTLLGVRKILGGAADERSVKELEYVGRLEEELGQS